MLRSLAVLLLLVSWLPSVAAQARFRGRLVDHQGQPHVNAIVGLARPRTQDLRTPPHKRGDYSPCFGQEERYQRLQKGEGHTDEDGVFDFTGPESPGLPYAILQPGYRVLLAPELWEAVGGEDVDLGVVAAARRSIYAFTFDRPDGSRALPHDRQKELKRTVLLGSTGGQYRSWDAVKFRFELEGEPAWEERAVIQEDGQVLLPLSEERVSRLGLVLRVRIQFPGEPVIEERFPSAWEAREVKSYTLDAVHLLKLRFHYPRSWSEEDPLYWLVGACDIHASYGKGALNMSGLGGYAEWFAKGPYTDVDLPVLENRDYWIGAKRWSIGPALECPAENGPFRPDGKRHSVQLGLSDSKDRAGWNPCGGVIPYQPHGVVTLSSESSVPDGLLTNGHDLVGTVTRGKTSLGGQGKLDPYLIFRIADGFHQAQVLPTPPGVTLEGDWNLTLQPWREVEIEMAGLTAMERRVARSPLLVQDHDGRRYGEVPGTRLRDRGDGVMRWRYVVNAGDWRAVPPDGLFAGLSHPILVEETDEPQFFVLER